MPIGFTIIIIATTSPFRIRDIPPMIVMTTGR